MRHTRFIIHRVRCSPQKRHCDPKVQDQILGTLDLGNIDIAPFALPTAQTTQTLNEVHNNQITNLLQNFKKQYQFTAKGHSKLALQ